MDCWEQVSVAIEARLYGGMPKLTLAVLNVLPLGMSSAVELCRSDLFRGKGRDLSEEFGTSPERDPLFSRSHSPVVLSLLFR